MGHRRKVIERLERLLKECVTESQRLVVKKQIEIAKTCSEEEIKTFAS
jgi:hypothetical protein